MKLKLLALLGILMLGTAWAEEQKEAEFNIPTIPAGAKVVPVDFGFNVPTAQQTQQANAARVKELNPAPVYLRSVPTTDENGNLVIKQRTMNQIDLTMPVTTDAEGNLVINQQKESKVDLTEALKPVKQKRVAETLNLSDFELNADDMAEIKAVRERLKAKPDPFSGIDEMLNEVGKSKKPTAEDLEWAKTVKPKEPGFIESIGSIFEDFIDGITYFPAMNVLIITLTIILIAFSIPLWKWLNKKSQ